MSIISCFAAVSYSCGRACFIYDRVVSCCNNGDKFTGQEAEVHIGDGISAHDDKHASRHILHSAVCQHPDLRRKSASVMETVCVTGEPGTRVHNLAVILSGRSA